MNRRRVLALLGTAAISAVSGCSVSVGTMDVTVRNCQPDAREVSIRVTSKSSESVIYDEQHDVPGESCGDTGAAPVEVEDLFTEAGEYHVEATSPELESVERGYSFEEALIKNNDDSVSVRIEEEGLVLS